MIVSNVKSVMSITLQKYLAEVRLAAIPALCLHNFPCQQVERQQKPEVEVRTCPELLLPAVEVKRSDEECCLVEQSVNAARFSFKLKAVDKLEEYLLHTYLRFMMHRAEDLEIVRRVPLPGYHLSFLVTSAHLERFDRGRLVDFMLALVESLSEEVRSAKERLKPRAQAVVADFWRLVDEAAEQAPQLP